MIPFNSTELIITEWSAKRRGPWSFKPYTGVHIVHIPTGIEVKIDDKRSVYSSKEKAIKELNRRIKSRNASHARETQPSSQSTSRELQDINAITKDMMAEFPEECTGRLSSVLRTCRNALRENVKMKAELAEMKAQYDIVKNLCDEFESALDARNSELSVIPVFNGEMNA